MTFTLRSNPWGKSATPRYVSFTKEFMEEFIALHSEGQTRYEIFESHGLPVDAMGKKTIKKTTGNWIRKANKSIALSDEKRGRPRARGLTQEEIVARQQAKIEMLQQENDFLRHSDQGCHYTSWEYRRYLSDRAICQSMSRRGNCWDNAPMESFFGHAKDELHLRRCSTFDDVAAEIADYIDYYNSWRPQAGLGKMTPAEFREYLLAKPIPLPVPVDATRENGERSAALPVSQ